MNIKNRTTKTIAAAIAAAAILTTTPAAAIAAADADELDLTHGNRTIEVPAESASTEGTWFRVGPFIVTQS